MRKNTYAVQAGLSMGLSALAWMGISAIGAGQTGSVWAQANEVPSLDRLLNRQQIENLENGSAVEPAALPPESATPVQDFESAESLRRAEVAALEAEGLAQTARSASDWDAVMAQWLMAISLAQSVPPESPSRIVAQRQMRSYLQQLIEVQQRTEQASPMSSLPSLGSDLFDSQLAGYLSYVATAGTPDVLIVGSSRALQGIDPHALQQNLAAQGYGNLRVFNFSVNGATAQVVDFVLSELLPQPLPPVIVWGDGSRAFNDGRRDRTWEKLTASPGYQALRGNSATQVSLRANATLVTARSPLPENFSNLDALGFSAVSEQFSPQTYYQEFARVDGRYDGAYSPFTLYGAQTTALESVARTARANNSQLIFVNLPLSDSYLDDYRMYYESQFQTFLQTQSAALGFDIVDLLTLWEGQSALFADPSHINQDGAAAIALQLSQEPRLLSALSTPSAPLETQAVENQTLETQTTELQ